MPPVVTQKHPLSMADDLKSSAHVWDGRSAPADDSPPAYIGATPDREDDPAPVASSSNATQIQRRPVRRTPYDPLRSLSTLPLIPYQKYNIADSTLSKDKITVTVKQQVFFSQSSHLLPFVLEQARLPPKPTLRIVGRRDHSVDFNITLNLTHLINVSNNKWRLKSAQTSPLQGSSRDLYVRNDPSIPAHIASTVKRFCNDRGENKSLTLVRSIEGIPTEMLAGQVRNLAAAIKYRGLLQIDFTCERSRVVIHKEPSGWFSSVLRLHAEQKYEVAESIWVLGNDSDQDDNETGSALGLQIGHEWWASWASTIRNAMIRKHKGGVGIDDWMDAKMGHMEQQPTYDWGQERLN